MESLGYKITLSPKKMTNRGAGVRLGGRACLTSGALSSIPSTAKNQKLPSQVTPRSLQILCPKVREFHLSSCSRDDPEEGML
jgi:hypothetical protein